MENSLIFAFITVGIAALITGITNQTRYFSFIVLLFSLSVSAVLLTTISSANSTVLLAGLIVTILSLGFILSRIKLISDSKISWLIPPVLILLLTISGKDEFEFGEYQFTILGPLVVLPILGALYLPLFKWKRKVLNSFFHITEQDHLNLAFSLIFIGIMIFLGSFFASYFGIYLVALGLIVGSFFNSETSRNEGLSLLLVSLVPVFMKLSSAETVDLLLGKTIEGALIGSGSVFLISAFSQTIKRKVLSILLGLIIPLAFIFGILMLVTQKSDFGGIEAFIGAIIGVAGIQLLTKKSETFNVAFISFLIAGGSLLIPLTINKEEEGLTQITVPGNGNTETGEKETSVFDLEGKNLDSLSGNYSLDEKSVQLTFQLGPKGGITKGAIKSFSGEVELEEKIENSKFSVVLPIDQLTTFSQYRDESIMEPGYFNASKYSEMKYESTSLQRENDYYILKGNFTMIGVKKPLDVKLKYLGMLSNSMGKKVPVLVGKSSIDRTLFGMKPDSKEGNIVDFEFKVELVQ